MSKEVTMKFTFAHNNFNVLDLDKSLRFYEEAWDSGKSAASNGGLYHRVSGRRQNTAPVGTDVLKRSDETL
jgi:predicted enzyme related to lactoylglutathione lyase